MTNATPPGGLVLVTFICSTGASLLRCECDYSDSSCARFVYFDPAADGHGTDRRYDHATLRFIPGDSTLSRDGGSRVLVDVSFDCAFADVT